MHRFNHFIFSLCCLLIFGGCAEPVSLVGPSSGVPVKRLKLWTAASEDGSDLFFYYNDDGLLEAINRINESANTLLFKYEYVDNRLSKWIFFNDTGESYGYIEYAYPDEETVVATDFRPTANDEFFVTKFLFVNNLISEIQYTSISWPEVYHRKQVFEHDAYANLKEVKVYGSHLDEIFNFTYGAANSIFKGISPKLALLSWGPEPFLSFEKQYKSVRKRNYSDGNLQSDDTKEYFYEIDSEGYPIILKDNSGLVLQRFEYY